MKVIRIGRAKNNDICIYDPKVSRHHLQLILDDNFSIRIIDLGSKHGTFVNNEQIKGERFLQENDEVVIGNTKLPWQSYFTKKLEIYRKKNNKKTKIIIALIVSLMIVSVLLIFSFIYIYKNKQQSITNKIEVANFEEYDDDANYKKETWEQFFTSSDSKKMKQLVDACDYLNPIVRNTAVKTAGKQPGVFNFGQVCEIFDSCMTSWSYVNDPKNLDYYAKASESIENGFNGDCDDFAILIYSMILSIGGEARINFAYGDTGGHAFTEVNITNFDEKKVLSYLNLRYNKINLPDSILADTTLLNTYITNDSLFIVEDSLFIINDSIVKNSISKIWFRYDEFGNKWLNLDWQDINKHPGGKYFNWKRGNIFYVKEKKVVAFEN